MSAAEPIPERLPGRVDGPGGLVPRRWTPADAPALVEAVTRSAEHLRPWMAWIAEEPMSVQQRVELIEGWERDWDAGGDAVYGVFADGQVAGGCGLHHRLGRGGLEIGYWIGVDFLRRGLASAASALLTDAAFGLPHIDIVQIRHDKANLRSAAVPRKLGFRMVREVVDQIEAPAEIGASWYWQIRRAEWSPRAPLISALSPRV